ncbi:glycosyltransferase family 4 protein [Thermoanaerobacterium sp. DL9XJH110]|uniref:glycosyltransferase family 4 protein n=1 Tax=Thermoanaerobacterium sp. DL9XJH110 TaxID=3386643 RepID=UPI003BB5B998
MKRVLHVLFDTAPDTAGKYLLNLISGWGQPPFEILAACPAGYKWEQNLKEKGVKCFELKAESASSGYSAVKELTDIISAEKVDMVHSHGGFSGPLAGRLTGCRVVVTRHTPLGGGKGIFHYWSARLFTAFFVDAIIAVSRAVKISLMEAGVPAGKIKIIYNGIEPPGLNGRAGTQAKNPGAGPASHVIAAGGGLFPGKGHEYLLKAMPLVLEKFPDSRLIIPGEGPLKPQLENLCRNLGIASRVKFVCGAESMNFLTVAADVFVFPSPEEGPGFEILEAMAAGKPVVAAEAGGATEAVKNGVSGLLVPPEDERSLAFGIIKILSSGDLALKLGKAARNTVIEKFSAEIMACKTGELYEKILSKSRK